MKTEKDVYIIDYISMSGITLLCAHTGPYLVDKVSLYRDSIGRLFSYTDQILLIGSPASIHDVLEEFALEAVKLVSPLTYGVSEDGIWARITPSTPGDVVEIASIIQRSGKLRVAEPDMVCVGMPS